MAERIIKTDRSVIPACDVQPEVFKNIVMQTRDIEGIGGYKIGITFLDVGLKSIVDIAREYTDKPIIYDHQKAGTDIHEVTPDKFMDSMVRARVNAIILFPQAGPITEYEWIRAAQERDLGVIVGGEMTHPRYLDGDFNEGRNKNYTEIFEELGIARNLSGFIRSTAPIDMYELAARMGVRDFVVPGNKPDKIILYKGVIETMSGAKESSYWSPGLVAQGGTVSEGAEAAGQRFHAITGRAVYWNKPESRLNTPEEIRASALELTSQLG